jgi:hypothetical protein
MKRLLFALLVGTVLTGVFFVLAGFFGGACHCVTPTTILFPYAAIVFGRFGWDSIGLLLIALQFPLYAIMFAKLKGGSRQALTLFVLLLAHAAATLVGLRVYHH